MSLFQFNVASAYVGGAAASSSQWESLSTHTLEGIQSANVAAVYPRQDALTWDGAGNQELVDRPRAELQLSYLWGSGSARNERYMGFATSPSGTTPALAGLNDERNYYLLINQDGRDADGYIDPNCRVLSLGQGVLTDYSFNASVGQPTTVNATLQGLNLLIQASGTGQPLPAIRKQAGSPETGLYSLPVPSYATTEYFAARPGAISLTFATGSALGVALSGQNACPVNSFGFTVQLPRSDMRGLGWAYPESRPINWPATVSIHAEATVNAFQLDALNRFGCPDSGHTFTVGFKNSCTTLDDVALQFRGAKLDTQSMAVAVGGGSSKVSLQWSLKIADLNRASPNFYINVSATAYASVVFSQVEYAVGSGPFTINLGTPCYISIVSGPGIVEGNVVQVSDFGTIVVRLIPEDGSAVQDITVATG